MSTNLAKKSLPLIISTAGESNEDENIKLNFNRILNSTVGFWGFGVSWVLTRTSSFKGIFVKYEYSHQYDLRIIAN